MGKELTFKTKIGKASSKGTSYKVTVPKTIIELLNLNLGDSLTWHLKILPSGDIQISLTPDPKKD